MFEHFNTLLKTFSVIPFISCTCKCSFSRLNIVKLKLKTTMIQEWLNSLMLFKIVQNMALKLNSEDIIDDFRKSII